MLTLWVKIKEYFRKQQEQENLRQLIEMDYRIEKEILAMSKTQ